MVYSVDMKFTPTSQGEEKMTHLSETIALYRNDPEVSSEWFERLCLDAAAIDADEESRTYSLRAVTPAEFDELILSLNAEKI
jgi:hypothetical protein